jgi:hypothetical protein
MGEQADALSERMFTSLISTAELLEVYLGDRLGLYEHLAGQSLTSGDLAARGGIAERYAREWLEAQAVSGFLEVDDVAADARERRYGLSEEHALVLLDRDATTYLTPYARMFVAAAQQLPAIMDAFRTGGGVNWRDYGPDMSEGQESGNRPTYVNALAEWLASVEDLHAPLAAVGPRSRSHVPTRGYRSMGSTSTSPPSNVRAGMRPPKDCPTGCTSTRWTLLRPGTGRPTTW